MGTLKIVAGILSRNPKSTRFIYEKNGTLFIRSGTDSYVKGHRLQTTLEGACIKWGFYPVENPPTFRDGQELMDNAGNFELTQRRTLSYNGISFK